MNGYLIPANSKKSMLIFGLFTFVDLIIFGVGVGISLLLMAFLDLSNVTIAALALTPGLLASALVFPIPNYHNVLTFINSAYIFYTNRQRYIWKGWCFSYDKDKK